MRYVGIHTAALRISCVWMLAAMATSSTARAQPAPPSERNAPPSEPNAENAPPASPEPSEPSAPAETSSAPIEAGAEALGIEVEGKMEKGDRPSPPEGEAEEPDAKIVTGAGAGSDVAYASQFVVELGGTMSFTRRNDITMVRLAQVIGWFVIDNLEISLLPDLLVINLEGETEVAAGFALEPSYHISLGDQVLLFAGLGLGLHWGGDPGFEFVVRPRIGADLLIGRSGLLKPALFMDVGTAIGVSAGGLEIGYTIML